MLLTVFHGGDAKRFESIPAKLCICIFVGEKSTQKLTLHKGQRALINDISKRILSFFVKFGLIVFAAHPCRPYPARPRCNAMFGCTFFVAFD